MANAIAAGTGAGSTTFTLADGQRKTVNITPATSGKAPTGCFYILSKQIAAGANYQQFLEFDANKCPFSINGNGAWKIERDTTRHPVSTALDLD